MVRFMRILFVHQNFPGQYRRLVAHFAAQPGCVVAGIGESTNLARWQAVPGARVYGYEPPPPAPETTHPYLGLLDRHVRRGQFAAMAASKHKERGFTPDVICAHPGWGEALYMKDVFPDARLLSYCEYYHNADGSDVGFEEGYDVPLNLRLYVRSQNAAQLIALTASDWGVCPTKWQRAQYPAMLAERISVIHDGIDTELVQPGSGVTGTLGNGVGLKPGDEIITFVSRNLEPYRGFHIFAQAMPLIQRMRPKARIVVVGGDEISYSLPLKGTTYRELAMKELKDRLDFSRIHFLGRVPYSQFVGLMQLSAVHVYLTYPFVLSWSMLEAMAAGCLVVGSRTPPVEEVIEHNRNGLLVDFFSPEEIAQAVDAVLRHPDRMRHLRETARQTMVERYDLRTVCLPRQIELLQTLAEGKTPQYSDI